jgi:hypothetical protein
MRGISICEIKSTTESTTEIPLCLHPSGMNQIIYSQKEERNFIAATEAPKILKDMQDRFLAGFLCAGLTRSGCQRQAASDRPP